MTTREAIVAEIQRVRDEDLEELHALIQRFIRPEFLPGDSRAPSPMEPPFRRDPRLIGTQFYEDPIRGVDPEDWPEAFE